MTAKRSGRQSANSAQQTRKQILCVAGDLFVEKGFDRVSVREIADSAGVSHGLIRHHFGSKQQIWEQICDLVLQDVLMQIKTILSELDPNLPANERYFSLITRFLATQLCDPRPMRLMVDAVRDNEMLFNYFQEAPADIEELFDSELRAVQAQGYLEGMKVKEMKWLICMFTDAPATLAPLLIDVYDTSLDKARVQHWMLACQLLATPLGIANDKLPKPDSLEEVALPWSRCITDGRSDP
ncbi:TetR/AcrR family transcriptional regulator [Ferrimonas sp. SCSIO 43195]|uniref:TetR/AcrR family transcriptional regulator n=1 Tax=Ferrimonas sp. SCSIO 43195 TaxID=2822844 RepID=UPI002075AD17|nr:TetR/AcrR family transcriptional regulator [Ferrimonas sp. SCSIO 43195]USD38870.1 TetR/AcrR family transcriptional regulator [Ferrimonas sp. SCSIO 43195]